MPKKKKAEKQDAPQKYYKVVTEIDGKLYSGLCFNHDKIRVEYNIGKPTIPKIPNSRLFVYTSEGMAMALAEFHKPEKERSKPLKRVFECTVKDSTFLDYICDPISPTFDLIASEDLYSNFCLFWQNQNKLEDFNLLILSTLQTEMVSELTLTNEILPPKETQNKEA